MIVNDKHTINTVLPRKKKGSTRTLLVEPVDSAGSKDLGDSKVEQEIPEISSNRSLEARLEGVGPPEERLEVEEEVGLGLRGETI